MDRRSFIKLTAVSGTTAALASCGNPDHQLIRFVPDDDIVPGAALWKPGVCPLCPSGCGVTVRVMDADADVVRNGQSGVVRILAAKKLEGNAAHPVNHGKLCARGQAGIQVTYHPDRITQPLKRSGERGDGRYEAISWDDAIGEVVSRLDRLAGAGEQASLAYLGRRVTGHRALLTDEFLARYGAPAAIVYELFADDVLRRANLLSFGREQLPTVDFRHSRHVLSFGADFLGTWNSPVANAFAYGEMRQGQRGARGFLVQVEARMSQTGANADQWVAVKPGTEGALALGLAHVIMARDSAAGPGAGVAGSLIEGWSSGLPAYAPQHVAAMTGVGAARIEQLAREFAAARPAVAVAGGSALAHGNGLVTALAVNALNALVGSVGQPGGVSFTPQLSLNAAAKIDSRDGGRATRSLRELAASVTSDTAPQLLFVDGANPVFVAPPAWKVGEALQRAAYIVSFSTFLDETSGLADLILPDHSSLESWADAVPESGAAMAVMSVAAPVMRPLYDTRQTGDVLLDIARRLARPLGLPWQNVEELLAATFAPLPPSMPDGDPWADAQERGGWWGELPASLAAPGVELNAAARSPRAFAVPEFDGNAEQFPFHLLPYASNAFLDGSLAHLPWLQEMPDPLTSAMWSSWVEINPATAARLRISQGDIVEIASSQGSLQSAAVISPGIAPDVVAMPVGQGHRSFTRYASNRGENPVTLLAPMTEPATGTLAWAATRVRVSRVGAPDGRLILFAGGMREHGDEHR